MRRPLLLCLLIAISVTVAACSQESPPRAEKPTGSGSSSAPEPPDGAITAQFFGMHDHDPVGDSWPKAPIGSFRAWDCGVMWREIETAPGVYNFSRLDAIVETAEKNDADVLLVLGQTPPFHAKRPNAPSFYGPGASSPPVLEAWTAYVRAVAERYAGRPVHYQVWNEANVKGFWRGTPAQMAELTKATYDVLNTISPRPKLVAPAFVLRLIGQRAWFDSFYAEQIEGRPVADFVDVVSLQLYPPAEGTPQTAMATLAAARSVLGEHGVDKPIWNTEVNYGMTGGPVEPAASLQQQNNVAQTLLLNAIHGVERAYWYGWDQRDNVNTVLSRPGSAPTDAGRTFRDVAQWLTAYAIESCTVGIPAATGECRLRGASGGRLIVWSNGVPDAISLPANAINYQVAGGPVRPLLSRTLLVGQLPTAVELRD